MKYLLLSFICFSPLLFNAQTNKFSFKMGDEYDLPRKTEDLAFVGNSDDGIVNLSLKKEELIFLRFDPQSLRKTSERPVDLSVTKNFDSEEVVDMQGKYYWIHSDWDKSAEKELLFYDKLDVKSGKIIETNHKLLENTKLSGEIEKSGFYRLKTIGKYKFRYNAEKKLLLVSYRFVPTEKNDKKSYDRIGLQVFDENMSKIWGKEFTMPYTEAIMDNSDFSIDSRGNAYLLAKVYDSDKRNEVDKATRKPAYRYEMMQFTKDSKEILRVQINMEDYFVNQPSLIESPTHEMIVAFTYSKKYVSGGVDGVFLGRIENGKLTKFRDGYYEFPVSEMEKYESARTVKKMEKADDYEGTHILIRDIIAEPDGSVFITLEDYNFLVREYTSASGNSYSSTTTFYYNNIYAVKISAVTGKMDWFRKIPKKQIGYLGQGGMSFKLIRDGAGYYFLYLDNKKNLELEADEVPTVHVDGKGGQLVVAKLDKAGKLTKEILFDTRDEDVKVFPTQFDEYNKNQFIGRAQLKKTLFQPLLITVN